MRLKQVDAKIAAEKTLRAGYEPASPHLVASRSRSELVTEEQFSLC